MTTHCLRRMICHILAQDKGNLRGPWWDAGSVWSGTRDQVTRTMKTMARKEKWERYVDPRCSVLR